MYNFIAKILLSWKYRIAAAEADLEARELEAQRIELEHLKDPTDIHVKDLEAKVKVTHGDELKAATAELAEGRRAQAGIPNALENYKQSAVAKRRRSQELRRRAELIFKK